jgi:hypothetical protein
MRPIHFLCVFAAIATICLCPLLPFLPGKHDSLAVPVALMAQCGGIVGLLLVPCGLFLLVSPRPGGVVAAAVAAALTWSAISLCAWVSSGPTLALATFVPGIWSIARVARRWRTDGDASAAGIRACAWVCVIAPLASVGLQWKLGEKVVESGRSRAIRNSAVMIADIERYRVAHGRYPVSLQALWPDYLPRLRGLKEYRYEPSGEAYNLFFEQFTFQLGAREIVMFNPRDEHVFTSHAMDILRLTPAALASEQQRDFFARRDTPHPHWKFFWFD